MPSPLREDDWSEIEALLASPSQAHGPRRRAARGWSRALAGVTVLIATGGLVVAGLGAAGQTGLSTLLVTQIFAAPPTAVALPTRVASGPPARSTIEEGRSVAEAAPTRARDEAGKTVVAAVPATEEPAPADTSVDPAPLHRHKHHHKHR